MGKYPIRTKYHLPNHISSINPNITKHCLSFWNANLLLYVLPWIKRRHLKRYREDFPEISFWCSQDNVIVATDTFLATVLNVRCVQSSSIQNMYQTIIIFLTTMWVFFFKWQALYEVICLNKFACIKSGATFLIISLLLLMLAPWLVWSLIYLHLLLKVPHW